MTPLEQHVITAGVIIALVLLADLLWILTPKLWRRLPRSVRQTPERWMKRSKVFFKRQLKKPLPNTWLPVLRQRKRLALVLGLLLLNIGLIGWTGWSLYADASERPQVSVSSIEHASATQDYTPEIRFDFNVPVAKDKLTLNMNPELPGQWVMDDFLGQDGYVQSITFVPDHSLEPNTRHQFYLSYIANPLHPEAGNEYYLEFTTPPLPEVTGSNPEDGTEDVLTTTELTFELDKPTSPAVGWQATLDPEQALSLTATDQQVKVRFDKPLTQGQAYTLELTRQSLIYNPQSEEVVEERSSEAVSKLTFSTVKAPQIGDIQPAGESVHADETIRLSFDFAMDQASVEERLSLEPETPGSISWNEAGNELTFTPENALQKDTDYTLKLAAGIRSDKEGVTESPIEHHFKTIGRVTVSTLSPSGGSQVGRTQSLKVEFNQEVDHGSAEGAFSISPSVGGSFSWDSNAMYFNPSGEYAYDTRYTYTIASGVQSVHGLDSDQSYSASFVTPPERVVLNVPMYLQQEDFTCNIAAARMLLAYHGNSVAEGTLKSQVGSDGSRGSGNPHNGYVSGYGTYWEPINSLVSQYRSTQLFFGNDLTRILNEVKNGNPVMTWGQNGWSTPTNISWTASDGTYINAVSGMHSVVVIGYVGPVDNPSHIIINDPWRGQSTLTRAKFMSNWSYFNVAMVVR